VRAEGGEEEPGESGSGDEDEEKQCSKEFQVDLFSASWPLS
jgi:hypothetical protein